MWETQQILPDFFLCVADTGFMNINVPAVSDRCLQKLNQLLRVSGVGPGRRHHLAWPQEGHLQGHGMVVEDKHLVLLFP